MDQSVLSRLRQRPRTLALYIGFITLSVLALNAYGMALMGSGNLLPHLFYIPIILTAYFFPRRGILFASVLSLVYFLVVLLLGPPSTVQAGLAAGRIAIFILVAAVVSLLTLRLQESELLFRGVAERSSDIILLTDTKGRATYVSPSFARTLGMVPAEIIDKKPEEFIHPDDIGLLKNSLRDLKEGTSPLSVTARTRKKNGDYLYIEYIGTLLFTNGEFSGLQVIGRDVTKRLLAEDASREMVRRMAEIIDFLPDPTVVIDRSGNVVAWNKAMEAMSRLSAAAVIGKGEEIYTSWIRKSYHPVLIHSVLLQDTEAIKRVYPHVHFEGRTVRTETEIVRTDGTRFSLWVSATPLIGDDGEVTGAIESLRDVTHQKKIERTLQLTLKKLHMLASITRHDILNQLMALRAFIELTKGRVTDPEKAEFLRKADDAAEAIQRQIEFTRMYENLGARAPKWFDVEELFRSAVSSLPLTGIKIDINTRGLSLFADPLIAKVFYNLVENSLRHGGTITAIGLFAEEGPRGMTLIYHDNGIGISAADRNNLFQKGYGKNTGLGLFLSREILSITGITITETGAEGSGARFEIQVPKEAYRIAGTG